MKFTIDEKYNVAYFRFKVKKNKVKSIEIGDDIIIDVSADGTIYGVEFLNAKKYFSKNSVAASKLTVVNETTGRQKVLAFFQ